jgi:aspartate racemase
MKTIGLIGGISWLSSIDYYKYINQMVNDRLGGVEAAKLILYSVNFAEVKRLTLADDWDGLSAMMQEAARKLEAAGCDCVMIGANTMHKIADEVQSVVQVPLINIATVTASAVQQQNIRKVALLGTRYTMQLDFYAKKLAERSVETIIPGQEDIDYINNAIYEEFGKGIFLSATKQRFLDIIGKLSIHGAEGVIFGCTEIPMLINASESPLPSFDTTQIHAKAAVDFALI